MCALVCTQNTTNCRDQALVLAQATQQTAAMKKKADATGLWPPSGESNLFLHNWKTRFWGHITWN